MRIDFEAMADVCARNDIERLRVFGSVARGEESGDSDVDLIADFATRKSLLDLVRIERELSQRLGRRVDLLTEKSLSPYLRDRILRGAVVVYDRAA
ncbi:MAG: nucleotidyltransferase family protein [Gemmatimonadota bacterium]|nr:nucleotidyltransferase family protein [Gemmatimonadota bacterium]